MNVLCNSYSLIRSWSVYLELWNTLTLTLTWPLTFSFEYNVHFYAHHETDEVRYTCMHRTYHTTISLMHGVKITTGTITITIATSLDRTKTCWVAQNFFWKLLLNPWPTKQKEVLHVSVKYPWLSGEWTPRPLGCSRLDFCLFPLKNLPSSAARRKVALLFSPFHLGIQSTLSDA